MSDRDGIIERIAALAGIDSVYADAFGRQMWTSHETRQAILADFGLPTASDAEAEESLARIEALRQGLVPSLVSVEAGAPSRIGTSETAARSVIWRVVDERGRGQEGLSEIRRDDGRCSFELPAVAAGYHRLSVEIGDRAAAATIIAAPRQCWQPRQVVKGARLWGVSAQVYGLRSASQIGIGEYSDIAEAARGAGALGASFLGLSPLHALFPTDRGKISPYSPSSRLFLETIHIDPTAIDGFAGSSAARLLEEPDVREAAAALRRSPLVDHGRAWVLKRRLLDEIWRTVCNGRTPDGFEAYCRQRGSALRAHAIFEALSEHFHKQGLAWSGEWPAAMRDAASSEVKQFVSERFERIAYHSWLQWVADTQLGTCAETARAAGMALSLYRDLAVGSDRGGSEIWATPERFGAGLSIGAPPDMIAPNGQDWGLPPLNPLALEREGLAAFRDLVAANMRHAGAIRIDHAFQLRRLFLIPLGAPAEHGAYVRYPLEALLAVLKIESHRAQCLVIAEDLGNAPGGFSDAIMEAGILSCRVLAFERHGEGRFKRPAEYPRRAVAVLNTHDLPTFGGWWQGRDIDLREALGLYDRDVAAREHEVRAGDRQRLAEALAHETLLPDARVPDDPPLEPAVRFVGRAPSALVSIALEDAAGELNQANLPGLDQGHPNWQRRLPVETRILMAPGGELARLAAALRDEGRGTRPRPAAFASPPPRATYRLQLNKDFTFAHAAAIAPYLARLGISHVYLSPILKARAGSAHGYDIVDHATINPELGGEDGFLLLSDALKAHGLGVVLDIVPNHMGIGGADNAWWLAVLEWGELSPHAATFDIDWERLGANHRLVLPFLADRYGLALEGGALTLAFDPHEGSFSVWHHEHRFPVSPLTYPIVLDRALAALSEGAPAGDVLAIAERLRAMAQESAWERRSAFADEAETLKRRLAAAVATSPALAEAIERACTLINGSHGVPDSFGTLHRILDAQVYRLAHWRVADSDVNYRRFFDITNLAGLRVEEPEVFARTHETIFRLVRDGHVQGLRIDHIDGLADPAAYLRNVEAAVGHGFYIVVEKILEPGESLRSWPIAGTTGYETLNLIEAALIDGDAGATLERLYRDFSGLEGNLAALLRTAKADVLDMSFASELEGLVSDLKRIADADRRTRDYSINALRRAIAEVLIAFPVYRSYLSEGPASVEDRRLIETTIAQAKRTSALPDRSEHDLIAAVLLEAIDTTGSVRPSATLVERFRRRFQQLTGPVMAKSKEDTFFYRYVRLIALNEVGGDPRRLGLSPESFHRANQRRAQEWPHAVIATTTHDTKRGEDARSRIGALSQLSGEWGPALQRWRQSAGPHLMQVDGSDAPDGNDQYLLLQTLLGAWPMELLSDRPDPKCLATFRERMCIFTRKALREAKRHTSWTNPNEAYEAAAITLIERLLDPQGVFLDAFRPLARRLAFLGAVTSLAKTVLKCTLPGVPDIYQGSELWDLALVDPDNRQPVDYAGREQTLSLNVPVESLLPNWRDGQIKQQILARILADRTAAPELYAQGDYAAVATSGGKGDRCLAFRRSRGDDSVVVAVPRLMGADTDEENWPTGHGFWGDTHMEGSRGRWRNLFTGEAFAIDDDRWPLGDILARLPVAVLRNVI